MELQADDRYDELRRGGGRRFYCACGGEIAPPLPAHCPHCGARISGIARRANPWPWLIIAALFAGVLALLLRLAGIW
jgi:hypothetical protein